MFEKWKCFKPVFFLTEGPLVAKQSPIACKLMRKWLNVHFVNYGPIQSEINNKAGYAFGHSYPVID